MRIAGVNVGKVSSVEPEGNMAEATFNVSDDGLPIHEDATIKVRPRLFLEGNFFLDLHPGSPSAPELDSGSTIPTTQTTTAVQIDEILTSLQSDTRTNLKRALEGYGEALNAVPTAAEDAAQDPDVQGLTGAQAINETFRYGGKAGRTSAIVNQAFLGLHPHDLSNLIRAQRDLFAKLASTDGALSDLITNFNITAGAFAVGVRQPLGLDPRARPHPPGGGALAAPPERRAAVGPQAGARVAAGHPRAPGDDPRRLAVARAGGQAAEAERAGRHRRAARRVGAAPRPGRPRVAEAVPADRARSAAASPRTWSRPATSVIDDAGGAYPFSTGQPNIREFFYGVAQLAGESQGFDGNGPFVRFQAGGGPAARADGQPQRADAA